MYCVRYSQRGRLVVHLQFPGVSDESLSPGLNKGSRQPDVLWAAHIAQPLLGASLHSTTASSPIAVWMMTFVSFSSSLNILFSFS